MDIAIEKLLNIGPRTAKRLEAVGIPTAEDLECIGAVEAYRRLMWCFPERTTRNALYALEGALLDVRWDRLPSERKADLDALADELVAEAEADVV